MNKNHFIFSYYGNKRTEASRIVDHMNLDNIKTIVEPFCGSSSLSFYIANIYPLKYKYVLNDISTNLIELYKILKDETKTIDFEKKVNDFLSDKDFNKEKYVAAIKKDDYFGLYIASKVYNIRHGLFKTNYKYKYIDINGHPFTKFIRTENIEMSNVDAVEIIEKNKDDPQTIIYLDPPYLTLCNSFYDDKINFLVYEYLFKNNFKNKNMYITIEKNWITNLIFDKYIILDEYNKNYESPNKNKVIHIFYNLCLK